MAKHEDARESHASQLVSISLKPHSDVSKVRKKVIGNEDDPNSLTITLYFYIECRYFT